MLARKLEKNIVLYKPQFDKMLLNMYNGVYVLDRVSMDMEAITNRIRYMIKNNKDLSEIPSLKENYSKKVLNLRRIFDAFVHSFIFDVVGVPDQFDVNDIIEDKLIEDVDMDMMNVKFKLIIISTNDQYLEYFDQKVQDDVPFDMFPGEFFRYMTDSYNDGIAKAYPELFENRHTDEIGTGKDGDIFVHNFTFQTTERCNLNCFPAGTKILMDDGSLKNIEDIELGDMVLGIPEDIKDFKYPHGESDHPYHCLDNYIPSEVTKIFINEDETIRVIYHYGGEHEELFRVTKDHPFLTTSGEFMSIPKIMEKHESFIWIYGGHSTQMSYYELRVEPYGTEIVYNIETTTHTYVANCAVVHNCTYCYQFNKTNMRMEFKTAKKFIDDLLADKYGYINRYNSPAIIIEFIGGEPFLEIKLTRKIYEYFLDRCYELNHPWFSLHRLSICSNGLLYFNEDVQEFFKDYSSNISFNISIDGNKELHDSCRIQPNGEGSYDIAMAALNHYNEYYTSERNSKMTLAPSNISYLFDSVVDFINNGMSCININCVFEEGWNTETANIEYTQLKKLADYIVKNGLEHIYIAIFNEKQEDMMPESSDGNSCGGTGSMLALRPNGQFYPCIRYMPTSLSSDTNDLCIGDVDSGIKGREDGSEILEKMDKITRRSQSNDICFDCPISGDCMSCFKAGTLIETINGPVSIEGIKVGDMVLTQSGKYHKVLKTHFRKALSNETMEIKVGGSPLIYTTRNHPFLVRHKIGVSTRRKDQGKPIYGEPEWVEADDILLTDQVCMLFKSFGSVEFDKRLAFIAGKWLSDGWRSDCKSWNGKVYPEFHICCGKHEYYEVFNIFKESGIDYSDQGEGVTVHKFLIKSNTRNEKNKTLIGFLKKCGKYSYGKTIPEEVYNWTQDSIKSFLEGYLSADGSFDSKRPNMIRFSSVSKKLAYGFSNILRMFGINPSYSERYPHVDIIDGRIVEAKLSYDVRGIISDKQLKYEVDYNKHEIWSSVKVLKALGASYNVYNITVEDDPTYYADGILVHNCSALGYSVLGKLDKRTTFTCIQNIAEALANVYYWNSLLIAHPEYNLNVRINNVPDEWALLVIDREELDELKLIESKASIEVLSRKYGNI